ncbi:hypothetical protein I302_101345 [Kwoniella bestiolae CBS 10118]|uniref:Small secreted protein n=1 Tax=Kwoniella bestiolae CBS 10118 TaxID=1296100 RepID=A0A1B9GBZ6_9TREE|nr:hypothetical protein I302_00028 [Kwoniella bestiolae CBS 10118]OCF28541.1 hypothetical protein I302_00028 [Kwoniella bestiolae CBS 10118]
MLFAKTLLSLLPLLLVVSAKPLRLKRQGGQCPTFALQDYAAFQISDGVAGDAAAEANAIFVDPFDGCDLSTVDADSLDNMSAMREAAEDAETELFNPQIDAATGVEADALQVGKIKNKVLKLTAFSQVLNIKIAQGDDASVTKLEEEQGKLTKNIATDEASAGEASQAAVGGGGASNAAADTADEDDAAADDTADEVDAAADDTTSTDDEEEATASSSAGGSTCTCAN